MNQNTEHENSATPIEKHLRGCVGYIITDEALNTILVNRDIESGTPVSILTKKQIDMCTAEVYLWCVKAPSISGNVEDADGGWKHKEGGSRLSASDKSKFLILAKAIYDMYGEVFPYRGSVKMQARGMRVWGRWK